MANPEHWTHQVLRLPDGSTQLEIVDERGDRLPVARGISTQQAARLLREIEAEAVRRRFAIAEIIRDPEFMARTVIAIKQDGRG